MTTRRLNQLVKSGDVKKFRRARATRNGRKPFRTFRLKAGVKIEKAVKSVR